QPLTAEHHDRGQNTQSETAQDSTRDSRKIEASGLHRSSRATDLQSQETEMNKSSASPIPPWVLPQPGDDVRLKKLADYKIPYSLLRFRDLEDLDDSRTQEKE
ncbi:hypothetical protein, partial [Antrihabitans spumae]